MRCSGLLLLLCTSAVFSQTSPQSSAQTSAQTTGQTSAPISADPEVARAQIERDRVRAMVETGAMPRGRLSKADAAVADAEDGVTIRKSIYGQDLTEDQARELVAAADRRLERRQKAYDDAKKLVDAGVTPAQSLTSVAQDLDFAREQNGLAENRARLAQEMIEMAMAEEAMQAQMAAHQTVSPQMADKFDGDGIFTPAILERVQAAFTTHFGKPLPISANGQTAVHAALGFDHRGRVDVAIHPDQPEGVWLRAYLVEHRIPFFAFRQAVPGKATGAHIHLGPISTHLAAPAAGGG